MNNEKGFTLIEMMIVLLIISVLLIITIPNITRHNSKINEKGCEALVNMVQAQVQAYEMDNKAPPSTINDLITNQYVTNGQSTCPDGRPLGIDSDGKVTIGTKTP
ncbi:prepilin-type N-terminal cleavage/methylation domain-containing protein [Cytobacillus spongiae]|jgi:competence protein ComGC|uniref:competence type IV pilus major pilin ComGC n=1 Tax=Cytobacillus spongiae TaxID=2901381 RepID=UPI001F427069|nr:competence type IV pilus major pilin ComGC [Cytobacillus spongiae]UII54835.1 prepilin-type N-terminal cleavage/methylation domain-containing protein [Cytobacillus spongiae]